MWFAINGQSGPPVNDDVHVSGVDVFVLLNKVGADNGSKNFGCEDWVLLGEDKNGILYRVCGDNGTVIGFSVAAKSVSEQFRKGTEVKSVLTKHQFRLLAWHRLSYLQLIGRQSPGHGKPCKDGYCPFHSGQQQGYSQPYRRR